MVAFVQQLPKLDADKYQALVASSGGHSHGGGETEPHAHAEDTPDDHDANMDADETARDAHEHGDDGHQH
jgi:hypothetical protein